MGPMRAQLVTVIVGACWYQLAIRDDTCVPREKSTRSQSVPDHVCTEYPTSGTAVTSCTELDVTSSVTRPRASTYACTLPPDGDWTVAPGDVVLAVGDG